MARTLRNLRRWGKHLLVRSRKYRYALPEPLDDIIATPGMNKPETFITQNLNELKIENIPQYSILGGDIMGGGRADWLLPQYFIDLEYSGPWHGTNEGRYRDALRNIGFQRLGYRVETLYERDLVRIKPRLLEIVGRPTGA